MKTPREILLKQHAQAQARLDEARAEFLHQLPKAARADSGKSRQFLWPEWLSLSWPLRLALGGAWLLIFGLHLATPDLSTTPTSAAVTLSKARPTPDSVQALREQHRLFAELVGWPRGAETDRPRFTPRPRTERSVQHALA